MPEVQALEWIRGEAERPGSQIGAEIDYFLAFYSGLKPTVFLTYEREACFDRSRSDLRITFDDQILCRQEALSLEHDVWGEPILEEGKVLMEIKTSGATYTIWLNGTEAGAFEAY